MRCKGCNVELSNFETTRKSIDSHEYFDLCNNCYAPIRDLCPAIERYDLAQTEDSEDDSGEFEEN